MQVNVRVRPGALFSNNRDLFGPGMVLEMSLDEANRRIAQGKVEMVGVDPPSLSDVVGKLSATEVIAAVQAASTVTALAELAFGEDRKTVLGAIRVKRKELEG